MNRLIFVVAGTLVCAPLPALAQGKAVDAGTIIAQAQKGPETAAGQQKTTTAPAKESDKDAPVKKKKEKAGGCG